jgi:molecular chaperone DnaJ
MVGSGAEATWHPSASGSRRTTTRSSACPTTATDKEITRAYRKLAKQYHPDANPGSEDRFKEISAAYDVLGDAAKRKEYDEVRRLGPPATGFGGIRRRAAARAAASTSASRTSATSSGDLFGGRPVGARGARGRRRHRSAAPTSRPSCTCRSRRPSTASSRRSTSRRASADLQRLGLAPGHDRRSSARAAAARGVLNDNQGLFSLSSPCPECRGGARRSSIRARRVSARGSSARAPGEGAHPRRRRRRPAHPRQGPGRAGAQRARPGDLYVTVHVAPHPLFGRRGRNLTLTVPVTFPEAALGATITVPRSTEPGDAEGPGRAPRAARPSG